MSLAETHRALIEAAFKNHKLLAQADHRYAVEGTIHALDRGELRVASPPEKEGGDWTTHAWIKEAILLYFALRKTERIEAGPLEWHDKIPVKTSFEQGVRIVPPGMARLGSFLDAGVILMPGFVNIGARVGAGTMVDTWATVGSCAQGVSASAASSSPPRRSPSSWKTVCSSARAPSSSRASASSARRSSEPA